MIFFYVVGITEHPADSSPEDYVGKNITEVFVNLGYFGFFMLPQILMNFVLKDDSISVLVEMTAWWLGLVFEPMLALSSELYMGHSASMNWSIHTHTTPL